MERAKEAHSVAFGRSGYPSQSAVFVHFLNIPANWLFQPDVANPEDCLCLDIAAVNRLLP